MIISIILAGGKGTRINSKTANKVTLPFLNKPMILYGVELLHQVSGPIIVVVGAFAESVKQVLAGYPITYAYQKEQLGTGHAVKIALVEIEKHKEKPELVLVGYGDHMMFYTVKNANELIAYHKQQQSVMTFVTTIIPDSPYGRIIRDKSNNILDIVEVKDASDEQRKISEINAGLYCFDYSFLKENINKIDKSPVTQEYYLTDLVKLANRNHQIVAGFKVPYKNVGIGINRYDELKESQKIYLSNKTS